MMWITKANLYLPISEQILRQVIDGGSDNLEKAISSLNVPQIASLLLLQNLSEMRNRSAYLHPERNLAGKIDILNSQLKRDALPSVITEVLSILNIESIEKGCKLLPSFGIVLLDEGVIKDQNYITFEGKWDYTFNERYGEKLVKPLVKVKNDMTGKSQIFTAEQTRIYQEIETQVDDHIHVQGYAGTGKSSLIMHLISMLDKKGIQVLILAERQTQIDALEPKIGQMDHVVIKTFAGLAYEIIPQDLTDRANQNMRNTRLSRVPMADNEIIRRFGVKSSGKFSSEFMVKAIHNTLARFCYSGDSSVQLSHMANGYVSLFDETTKRVVLEYAEKLWKEIVDPTTKDFKPPISGYHRIKWAALNGWQIPRRYTHILIDECHDLAKPMLQILDCSPQAVISLGDEYQNLQGKSQQRSNIIRNREVIHSVRCGSSIEKIVNPIIAIHPGKTKVRFHGNPSTSLDITYYDQPQVPDKPVAILVKGMWGLFEWAQRVASKNVNLSLITDIKSLNMFVDDCIELYRPRGVRARHWELFRFKDWDEVASHYHNNQSFQNIDQMLRKGYQYKDWEKTSAQFAVNSSRSYLLGRIEDVRNHEFQSVLITPEVVSPVWQAKQEDIGVASSAIYVAVTRAKHSLIVPQALRSWIEEISD